MRLSPREIDILVSVLGSRIRGEKAELYLFGSRTQDRLRGGDIDILVVAQPEVVRRLRAEKESLLAGFKKVLGERRIDLVVAETPATKRVPFLRTALRTAILLKRWGSRRRRCATSRSRRAPRRGRERLRLMDRPVGRPVCLPDEDAGGADPGKKREPPPAPAS